MDQEFISRIDFDDRGLVPAIIQDNATGAVLMLGYMNRESLQKTLETRRTWFWSRSRGKLWNKGESSGCYQDVREVFFDCDADAILVKVDQTGVVCHTGRETCFFNKII